MPERLVRYLQRLSIRLSACLSVFVRARTCAVNTPVLLLSAYAGKA